MSGIRTYQTLHTDGRKGASSLLKPIDVLQESKTSRDNEYELVESNDEVDSYEGSQEMMTEEEQEMNHTKVASSSFQTINHTKKVARLTVTQLASLYRRLDINADGEVDLPEFLQISRKLKLHSDPQFLAETFRKVDSHGTGKLTLPQFTEAYNLIYDHDPDMDVIYSKMNSHVRACRYGLDKFHKKFIFEVYTGSLTQIVHKTCYEEDGSSVRFYVDRTFKGKAPPSRVSKAKGKEQFFDLDYIVSLIDADGEWNAKTGSNIMWWVDVCSEKITPKIFIKAFALPRVIEPMFQLEIFDRKRSNRLYMEEKTTAEGDVHGNHHVNSLNMFVQTMYLDKFPIVNPHPKVFYCLPKMIKNFLVYWSDKLAFLFTQGQGRAKDHGFRQALERAERVSSTLCEEKGLEQSMGGRHEEVDVDYLLTSTELKSRVPRLNHNTLSLHLLDRDCGCRVLLTFHRMEDESQENSYASDWTSEQMAECGIIGRIVAGVFKKLKKVILNNGVASMGGELADSTSALAALLTMEIHNFTIGSLGSFDTWINKLEKDIQACAVTKHGAHIRSLTEKLQVLKDYVTPIHEILHDMIDPDSPLAPLSDPFLALGMPVWTQAYLGDEVTGTKGTKYWKERVDFYANEIDKVANIYVNKLNEQRNSFTFVLSIFTIVSWPFAFLTAYWGTNHTNIVEYYPDGITKTSGNETYTDYLTPHFYPEIFQGINLFWIVNGVVYFFITLLCLHYRIFYTAS